MTAWRFFRLVIAAPLAILVAAVLFLVIYLHVTPDPFIYRKPEEPGRVYLKLNDEEERFLCDCPWLPGPRQPDTTNQYTDPKKVVTEPPAVPEEKVAIPKVEVSDGDNDSPRYCDSVEEEEGDSPILRMAPPYPEDCFEKGAEGRVVVEVDIDADGNVTKVEIIESADQCFNDAVRSMMTKWKYRPVCDDNGQPYSRSHVRQTIIFEIAE